MKELTEPPMSDHLTDHDRAHLKTYLRVLDGVADGADPAEIARVVLGADLDCNPEHGYRLFEVYHRRAVWMTQHGYRELAGLGDKCWQSPPGVATA